MRSSRSACKNAWLYGLRFSQTGCQAGCLRTSRAILEPAHASRGAEKTAGNVRQPCNPMPKRKCRGHQPERVRCGRSRCSAESIGLPPAIRDFESQPRFLRCIRNGGDQGAHRTGLFWPSCLCVVRRQPAAQQRLFAARRQRLRARTRTLLRVTPECRFSGSWRRCIPVGSDVVQQCPQFVHGLGRLNEFSVGRKSVINQLLIRDDADGIRLQ